MGGAGIIAVAFLGLKGFEAGEMGNMIGMFSVAGLLLLVPCVAARAFAVYGLAKRRRPAAVLTIVLSVLVAAAGLTAAEVSPLFSLSVLLYAGLCIWAAVLCRKRFPKSKGGAQ